MKKTILLLLTLIITSVAFGQTSTKPVTWTLSVKMTDTDHGIATITATPSKGWHLYGTDLPQGGPKATVINLSESSGVTFKGAPVPTVKPTEVKDPMFDLTLTWWEKPVSFTVPFTVTRPSGRIKAVISFMACDNNTCVPPMTETLFATVKSSRK